MQGYKINDKMCPKDANVIFHYHAKKSYGVISSHGVITCALLLFKSFSL